MEAPEDADAQLGGRRERTGGQRSAVEGAISGGDRRRAAMRAGEGDGEET